MQPPKRNRIRLHPAWAKVAVASKLWMYQLQTTAKLSILLGSVSLPKQIVAFAVVVMRCGGKDCDEAFPVPLLRLFTRCARPDLHISCLRPYKIARGFRKAAVFYTSVSMSGTICSSMAILSLLIVGTMFCLPGPNFFAFQSRS